MEVVDLAEAHMYPYQYSKQAVTLLLLLAIFGIALLAMNKSSVQRYTPSVQPTTTMLYFSGITDRFTVLETDTYNNMPDSMAIVPNVLVVNRSDTVIITVYVKGVGGHNLAIPAVNVSTNLILPGQNRTITFIAPSTAGRYWYDCTVADHRFMGMNGTLIVR